MVTFVPLVEIAKILYRYKNSVLKYNPRCFLGLKNNQVNPQIANTVKNKSTNEFALFNNGITILSDDTQINSQVAKKDRAQLIITNPQIINGDKQLLHYHLYMKNVFLMIITVYLMKKKCW